MQTLHIANAAIALHAKAGFDLSPAGDWLLDNFHLIDAQLKEIHTGLPRRYYESLPVLRAAPLVGLPRIYGVAWAFVAHTDSAFDERTLIHYLMAYQESCPLSLAELWALPTTLRVVLIENLRRLAERIVCAQADNTDQAEDNLSVRNAIISLRAIDEANWQDMVDQSSALMRQMLASHVFAAEQKRTQDESLYAIERLATSTGQDAQVIAEALLTLMQTDTTGRSVAAAYWLSGSGRPALWQKILGANTRVDWHYQSTQWFERVRLPIYGLVSILALVGLTASMVSFSLAQTFGVLLLMVPISEAVLAVMNRLISESVRPRYLPRFAFDEGIPAAHRVLVAIPTLLSSEADIHALTHRLHLHYLANPELEAQFALLTDWQDAKAEKTDTDDALLQCAKLAIVALNERYPTQALWRRFILLHRARTYSQSEQCWIGWERKRGKLQALITALAQGAEGQYAPFNDLGELSYLAGDVSFVLTLDSDTQLPPGRLRELVGVAAHPLNAPQLDASGRTIVSGYGIFQPRIVTPLPTEAEDTYFHWLFAGQCGIDTYSSATSEVYQDLFAEGTFTGKGLLHVRVMDAVLSGRNSLPVESVLSHDLLEGALARCATVTDITLIEDAPSHPDVAASRIHRWTRGDWQLLPLLYQSLWQSGARALSTLNKWKLFDNLRRSLVPVASLLLLLLAMFGYVVSLQVAVALVVVAYLAGPLLGVLAALIPSKRDVAVGYFFREGLIDVWRVLVGSLWHLALLPQHAFQSIDAIVRTLYRLAISRRHLLQWKTAAAAQLTASPYFLTLARQHWQVALAVLCLLFLGSMTPNFLLLPWAIFFGLLWLGTPLWIYAGSLPRCRRSSAHLLEQDRDYLLTVARETWTLFERTVLASERHLPPDNLQTSPYELIAHRTSPTNIGLYLLSACCARAFGWIDTTQMLDRLEATQATLATLQRYKGHFLNWYDTQTGAPLLPMYVSTVDSGNLSGSLLAVSACCKEMATEMPMSSQLAPLEKSRLLALAESFERLAWAPDYAFLYHPSRHLFHIGFRLAEQQLDASFYDLLASESRLTSLLAIAKGDVPSKHWAALGRPFYVQDYAAGLRSWSGSMFEYLMPSLLLDEPKYSALHVASCMALREQISYADRLDVPWGMSESAYAQSDDTLAYQYGPQGVPRLALRRTPEGECVVAPYATALAAQLDQHVAVDNFKRFESLSARTAYGFMEAVDFSPARQISGAHDERVQTYMAHHQGMTIVALANVLLQGAPRRWGMANAHIQAVASLLQERLPREISARYAPSVLSEHHHWRKRLRTTFQEIVPSTAAPGLTQVLSNGRYSVLLCPSGAGYSRLGVLNISRWRDDALREAYGSFFYLRRKSQTGDALVSLTRQSAQQTGVHYCCTFHADRVCFDAIWSDLRTRITIWVSPEDNIEFRQVELFNLTRTPIDVTLYSAFDVSLSPARADEAHPAFANLFVRAEYLAKRQAVVLTRQPRLEGETAFHAAHFLIQEEGRAALTDDVCVQFDRAKWQGRNHAHRQPLADFGGDSLTTGLDPVCAMSIPLRLEGASRTVLTLATAASHDEEEITRLLNKYQPLGAVQHASLMSITLAGARLRAQKINAETLTAIQTMTTALIFSLVRSHSVSNHPVALDKRLLWRIGISGDQPLVVISVQSMQGLGLVRSMLQALRWWSWCGVACDVVVLNAEPVSYLMPLQYELQALRERYRRDCMSKEPYAAQTTASLYLLREDGLTHEEYQTLLGLARLHWIADGRSLVRHIQNWQEQNLEAYESDECKSAQALVGGIANTHVADAQSGYSFRGNFEADEFLFTIQAARRPAKPWINVLSNPAFGAQISESGGGYSWAINSRLNQLTAWSNDPVMDTPSEWFLLQDQHSDELWSLTPLDPADTSLYQVSHGQGYSSFKHTRDGLQVTATWCVDTHSSVKQIHVDIQNFGKHSRKLRLVGVVEWLMGASRADRMTLHTAKADGLHALLATQCEYSAGFGGGTAFFALTSTNVPATEQKDARDWTCDRRECFDATGSLAIPKTFLRQAGSGLDPCATLSAGFELLAGASKRWTFLLGYAVDQGQAKALAKEAVQAIATPVDVRLRATQDYWNQLLGAVSVKTPDPLFDVMVNRWLIYQTVSCRLWARAGFYQAGGAIGFRDQLQDAMALSWVAPQMLRDQILLADSRQFEAGDVQHWWHEPTGAGIRTHSSDDLLWLPYACWHYVQTTGQVGLFDQTVCFIEGAVIPDGQSDVYETPHVSTHQATVYEHCARAIDRSLAVGMHGLPLMRGGDWNDGMNYVGSAGNGQGESVWLGWFLCRIATDFIPLAEARGEAERVERWRAAMVGWQGALVNDAWDGEWFKRGFFGSGQALGSHANSECQIDAVAQTWSVLSKLAPLPQQQRAMASVQTHLVDARLGLIKLLTPPFANSEPSPGYIQSYPPGVRENGGQYSHAAIWTLMAQAQLAQSGAQEDLAYLYFTYLSPAHRAANPVQGAVYGLEPYVVAGDICSEPPYAGRGGWSWYTGASAWLHRAAIESIFGLQQRAETLCFKPCLPSEWLQAEMTLRRDNRTMRFIVIRMDEQTEPEIAKAKALAFDVEILRPLEWLNWTNLPLSSKFVIPI